MAETPHIWPFLKYNDYSAPSGPRNTLYFRNGQIFVVSPTHNIVFANIVYLDQKSALCGISSGPLLFANIHITTMKVKKGKLNKENRY